MLSGAMKVCSGTVPGAEGTLLGRALSDPREEQRGDGKRERVDRHRQRGPQEVDQEATETRSNEPGARPAQLELAVPVDEVITADQRRQVGLVGNVEEDGEHADGEANEHEVGEGEHVAEVGDGDRGDQECATEIAADEDRTSREAVDDDARNESDEQEGEEVGEIQDRDLERRGVEEGDRNYWECKIRDTRSKMADRLCRPEAEKAGIAQDPRARSIEVYVRVMGGHSETLPEWGRGWS